MSKSTYKKAMQRLTGKQEKQHGYRENPATTFVPSKDNPVELTTATFGNPRTVEVVRKPRGRASFKGRSW